MIFMPPSKIRIRGLVLAALLPVLLAGGLAGQEGVGPTVRDVSYLSNGDFKLARSGGGLPESWEPGEEGSVMRMVEDGRAYLRLVAEKSGQLVRVTQAVPIPAGVHGLEFRSIFRNKDVKFGKSFVCDARAQFGFTDAEGNPLKGGVDQVFDSHAQSWREISRKFLVPEGAAFLRVTLCLNRPASGTLDVAEVRLVAMEEKEAQDMAMIPVLAARKKEEDLAEVMRLLALPPVTQEIRVTGNRLETRDGREVRLQGVNVPSLEWSSKGENIHRSIKVAVVDWKANAIRLPVSGGYWFGRGKGKEGPNDAGAYRAMVDDAVKLAAGQGAYLILDLHYYGGPQETAVEFWKDAAARYANHPAVLFDLFNEPHGISWDLWQNGGVMELTDKATKQVTSVQVVGMQTLVDTVRSTGARNIIVAGGLSHALNLSGILEGHALTDASGNGIMYATHFYNWHGNWEKNFLQVSAIHPVLVGEFGADVKKMSFVPAKNQEDPYTWMPDAMGMIQKYNLNWTAFSFHPKATPVLIKDWDYEPTPFFGVFVKEALKGKTYPLERMR